MVYCADLVSLFLSATVLAYLAFQRSSTRLALLSLAEDFAGSGGHGGKANSLEEVSTFHTGLASSPSFAPMTGGKRAG
jgi:hypothetical protein